MSVLPPGFSERVFEFSFNAEYAQRNMALLAAAPYIPTQNEEKTLGYDVRFELRSRGVSRVIALQHKVARYVDQPGNTNRHFWNAAGGPYFAFRLDVPQYNRIVRFSAPHVPHTGCYYCAPVFASHHRMNSHYLSKTVEANSIWIDVFAAGQILDREPHTIVYAADGSRAFRFSGDPVELKIFRSETLRAEPQTRTRMTDDDAQRIYSAAFEAVLSGWPDTAPERPRRRDSALDRVTPGVLLERPPRDFRELGLLLSSYAGLSVLVETPPSPPPHEIVL
ncbi:hypothetical protein KEX41_28245 (plasmid) [Burkholderia thailandensis]|uniref:hypothetical protein n=1 Tax=Burkholderia thailandensis TaxID=57975 RepID=UPI00192D69E7|nr:hypothetical protein [Burkholderia thailandensis]MBS2132080.1 hypothetical protein [Burkholderia thailandensis]QRA15193.1 hypothetical protein JMY07_30280 [Burkholderia thailandensis]